MFYSPVLIRALFLLILFTSYLYNGNEAGLLKRLIYSKKHRYARHLNTTANAIGTVFENLGDVSVKGKNTIVNIDGNADDNDYIPLHIISADNDKETLYRENTLLKQKIEQQSRQDTRDAKQNENLMQTHSIKEKSAKATDSNDVEPRTGDERHHTIDVNQDAASVLINEQPNVVIRGAKLISLPPGTKNENSNENDKSGEMDAIHIHLSPIELSSQHSKRKSQPRFLNALMTEVGPNKKPSFLNALVAEERLEDSPKHKTEHSHALSTVAPTNNLPKHNIANEDGFPLTHPLIDPQALMNQISGYLISNPMLSSRANEKYHNTGFEQPIANSLQHENHKLEFVNPLYANSGNDYTSPGSKSTSSPSQNLFDLSATHHSPVSMQNDNPFLRHSDNMNFQGQHRGVDFNSAKQTLFDITKSLGKNENLGGTMVYIPKVATVGSHEQSTQGTQEELSPTISNIDRSSEQINHLLENSLRNRYPSPSMQDGSGPTSLDTSSFTPLYNFAGSSAHKLDNSSPRGLDNSHIVNEINEELKAFQHNNYAKEIMKSDGNIPLLGQSTRFLKNPFEQPPFQGASEQVQANNVDYRADLLQNKPITPFNRQMLQANLYPTQLDSTNGNTQNYDTDITSQHHTQMTQSLHTLQFPNNTSLPAPYPKIRVLCIGDSLTSGFYGDRHVYHPYTIMLEFLLNNNIADEFQLITKGSGGEKVYQMHERLKKYLISEQPLDLVIILGGLNDLIKLDINVDIYKHIVMLHELCHSFGVSTVSLTIPETHMPLSRQVYANYDQFLVVWGSLNERIRNYHSNWTIPCDLARKFPLASLSDTEKHAWWSEDFIHPTIEGYNQIGRIIYSCIVSIL